MIRAILVAFAVVLLATGAWFFLAPGQPSPQSRAPSRTSTPRPTPPRPALPIKEFRDALASGGEGPIMVEIPGGTFLQGSPDDEPDHSDQEEPLHEVTLRGFSLGKFEVTRGEFRRFIEATGYQTDAERNTPVGEQEAVGCFSFGWNAAATWRDPGYPQDDQHPVVCVSSNDAMAYAAWLSRETGKHYRLPSESESEYTNRAGTETAFPWGDDGEAGCVDANYADASLKSRFADMRTVACSDGHVFTAPVGSLRANPFGLHDTAGNVWERVDDCYNEDYDGAPVDGSAWASGDCAERVLKGGSWGNTSARWLRAALRGRATLSARTSDAGFRVARD